MVNPFVDSYPEHLGQQIVEFILSLQPEEWDLMAARAREIEVSLAQLLSIERL